MSWLVRIWLYFEFCSAGLLGKIQNTAKFAPVKADALGFTTLSDTEENVVFSLDRWGKVGNY